MLKLIKADTLDIITSAYFVPVDDLINLALLDAYYPYPPQILSTLNPGSITFLMTLDEEPLSNRGKNVIATVSAEPDESLTRWKIKSLAVHPSVQKRGLGDQILRCIEKEIFRTYQVEMWRYKRRPSMWKRMKSRIRNCYKPSDVGGFRSDGKLHIQIETVEGTNRPWFRNRGWKVIERTPNLSEGYTSLVMEKEMEMT